MPELRVGHGYDVHRLVSDRKLIIGGVEIEFERDGPEIVLRIADDGAGMNIDAIRTRAIERGLLTKDSNLPDEDIIQFVSQILGIRHSVFLDRIVDIFDEIDDLVTIIRRCLGQHFFGSLNDICEIGRQSPL